MPSLKYDQTNSSTVAIVGIGCRFPGDANTPESFWDLLINQKNAVVDIPSSRWDINTFYDETVGTPGKMYSKRAAVINDISGFDADFFDISPREAVGIDPQQRLLLEVVWEALEDAGISPTTLKSKNVGVYVGLGSDDYAFHLMSEGGVDNITPYNCLGTGRSVAAGRIAYTLGINGPVMQVDTACSSSLTALHLANEDIKSGKTSMAIVAGVNLILSPHSSIACSQLRALSPDSQCKTFDASANGYVRGEGCGVVILKSEANAKTNKDDIYAVLKGSSINHDGRSNGLTAPSRNAQEGLLKNALTDAGLKPEDITYLETHGTGTSLGDPIELEAIGSVYRDSDRIPLYLGALKSNIGHLEAASGIASIIKTALVLKHQRIPSNLHFETPTPYVNWERLPVKIPVMTEKLPKNITGTSFAGVSSFGLSGTNVHFILGESETTISSDIPKKDSYLVAISAKTPVALEALKNTYLSSIPTPSSVDISALSYTSQQSRSGLPYRQTFVMQPLSNFADEILQSTDQDTVKNTLSTPKIAFIFTGQGSQYAGMGENLYKNSPIFKSVIDECDAFLLPFLKQSVKEIMWGDLTDLLNQTEYTQPCLFVFEYALSCLWKEIGVTPDVAIGHSLGEIVAATLARVFTLHEALKIVFARSQLMIKSTSPGCMAAIIGDAKKIEKLLVDSKIPLDIAAYNSHRNLVVSGSHEAVETFCSIVKRHAMRCQILPVSHAFHSKFMDPMLEGFASVMQRMNYRDPEFDIISTYNETSDTAQLLTPEYWVKQIRNPVRFSQSLDTLAQKNINIVIEIGPASLLPLMKVAPLSEKADKLVSGIKKGRDEYSSFLSAVGILFTHGAEIEWDGLWLEGTPRQIKLPTYPFQRNTYWEQPPKRASLSDSMHQEIDNILGMSEAELDTLIGNPLMCEGDAQ